jgi:aarF domain-containing kinase
MLKRKLNTVKKTSSLFKRSFNFTKTFPLLNKQEIPPLKLTTFQKLKQFLIRPPPMPYNVYRVLFWSTFSFFIWWFTSFLILSIFLSYKYFTTKRQEEQDALLYEQEKKNIQISDDKEEDYNTEYYDKIGFFHRLFRWISTSFRIVQLGFFFSPILFLFPLSYFSDHLFKNVFCKYFIFAMSSSGPCFIKLAQWIGSRRDLFNNDLIDSCSEMHSNAPSHTFEETKNIIESIYGKKLEELFETFVEEPIASGSIAQVHIASLKNKSDEEKWCVIKVRHPNVEEQIYRDLFILKKCASVFNFLFPSFSFMNVVDMVDTFSNSMNMQTDLRNEARNLLKFNNNFRRFDISFPKPIPGYVVHSSVLVETYEKGVVLTHKLKDLESMTIHQKNEIARLGTSLYLKMMLVDNFIHADLHPGNILVRLEDPVSLVVLDAGLVAELSEYDKKNFIDLFATVVEGNGIAAAELMVHRARNYEQLKKNPENIKNFTYQMAMLIKTVNEKPLQSLDVGNILNQVLEMGKKYQVIIEPNFTTLVLGTVVIEGLGKTLNSNFEFVKAARPFLIQDKNIRDAYITSQLVQLKNKKLSEKIFEWFDLVFGN